jgi:uncharacterized membrane protein YhaH (DUF805 family)
MTFGDAVKTGFKKYFDFSGRTSRSEYWFWLLFVFLLSLGGLALDIAFDWGSNPVEGSGPLATLVFIGTLIPNLAVSVRRLHDTNRSAWWLTGWYLYIFIFFFMLGFILASDSESERSWILVTIAALPLLGLTIAMFVFACLAGTPGANRYGQPEASTPVPATSIGMGPKDETALVDSNASRWVLSGFDSIGNMVRFEFEISNRSARSYIVGRNREVCDFAIDDPGVSRKHAEIVVNSSGVFIRDLGSSNGTRVNGQKLSTDLVRFPANGTLTLGAVDLSIFGS